MKKYGQITPANERKMAQIEHNAQHTARAVAAIRGQLSDNPVRERAFDRSGRIK